MGIKSFSRGSVSRAALRAAAKRESFPVEAAMPLTKITCPKCRAVLKPAKPVPEGKTIKCPKCEEMFKAGETPADARARAEAVTKKPSAAPAAKADEEEEEEEATYSVVRDEDLEKKAQEAERRKRKRMMKARMQKQGRKPVDDEDEDDDDEDDLAAQLLRNLKAKDPRGKAQEMVVTPSNWLLRTGLIGFFAWVISFIFFIIPVVFPNIPDTSDEQTKEVAKAEKEREAKEAKARGDKEKVAKFDLFEWVQERPWAVAVYITLLLLGLVHGGLIAYGAVRLQSLESFRWAVTSCILTIFPLYMGPLWLGLYWLFDNMLDADPAWGPPCVVFLWGPLVGGLCLKQVLNEKVKAGFAYKPD
jgi:hypothetical protein